MKDCCVPLPRQVNGILQNKMDFYTDIAIAFGGTEETTYFPAEMSNIRIKIEWTLYFSKFNWFIWPNSWKNEDEFRVDYPLRYIFEFCVWQKIHPPCAYNRERIIMKKKTSFAHNVYGLNNNFRQEMLHIKYERWKALAKRKSVHDVSFKSKILQK